VLEGLGLEEKEVFSGRRGAAAGLWAQPCAGCCWRPVLWSCFSVAVGSRPRECGRRCWVCGGFSLIGFPKATGGGGWRGCQRTMERVELAGRGKDKGSVGCCGENRLRERGEVLAGP
jgi:hypothetical protein